MKTHPYFAFVFALVAICTIAPYRHITAQDLNEPPTSTPVQVRVDSITMTPIPTATVVDDGFSGLNDNVLGLAQEQIVLEALSDVNVRSSPEISEDNRIGTIRAGERYPVIGRYFNWIQFQYDRVPSNRAWVYQDLVTVIGAIEAVPTLDVNPTPTIDSAFLVATQTREAVLEAPGGFLTVTAQARIISIPDSDTINSGEVNPQTLILEATPKPTFTYPPNYLSAQTDRSDLQSSTRVDLSSGVAGADTGQFSLIAILLLGLGGILGTIYSISR